MNKRVVVTSNCQTAGLTSALSLFVPKYVFIPVPISEFGNVEKRTSALESLGSADIWMHTFSKEESDGFCFDAGRSELSRMSIPTISFNAFHPDLIYILEKGSNKIFKTHLGCDYHSAIAYWAYINGFNVAQSHKLFNGTNFKKLGYLDLWGGELAKLKANLETYQINFDKFYTPIQMEGVFMYSTNHPKINVLIQLAKHYASLLGAGENMINSPVDASLRDVLAGLTTWPIYPEIAQNYGFTGSYAWKIHSDTHLPTLVDFLEYEFRSFDGMNHDNYFVNNRDISLFNLVTE